MTLYFVNLMWAIVLFGVLLWTTACVALNAGILPADTRREQHGDDGAAPTD